MLTRAEIERIPSHLLSSTGKLVVEWLSRQPAREHTAKEIGQALGMLHSDVAGCAIELRQRKLIESGARPYGAIELTAEARAAYAPPVTPVVVDNSVKKKASAA